MRLALVYARMQTVELFRYPSFSLATLAFPVLFFVLFGLPRAHAHPEVLLASYAAFAVLGIGFFQFGVSAAIERVEPWSVFLRTLPAPPGARIAGRIISALLFAAASVALLVAVALATTSAALDAVAWLRLAAALLLGSLPFVTLGVAIAYWASPRSALPIANILYTLLAYAGGLWTGPRGLPHAVAGVSPYTPTRQWADLLWPAVTREPWSARHWLLLGAYLAAFGLLAVWGYRRDEGQRFR